MNHFSFTAGSGWRLLAIVVLMLVTAAAKMDRAAAADAPKSADPGTVIYEGLRGTVVLDNERVRVEQFLLEPGQATGRHHRAGAQLLVIIHGGVLRSVGSGRETLWQAGRAVWEQPEPAVDEGVMNVGSGTIQMTWVTIKPAPTRGTSIVGGDDFHLGYPNIPGEDLLENDRVVVQRFTVYPGQWEGVHAHRPNMLYIHIKGGYWADRTYQRGIEAYPFDADGKVGWEPTIDISVGHQSGNVGKEPIDLIWVTLKD